MKEMKERPLVEAALEIGEAIADQFISNPIVKDIPCIGIAIKVGKAFADIPNRLLLAKISRFLTQLDSVSPEAKAAFQEKMTSNTEEAEKVGEAILFTLDKASDLEKPKIIAMIFLSYMDNRLNITDFRRITEAINQSFTDDLMELAAKDTIPDQSQEECLRYLTSSGLTKIASSEMFDDAGKIYYELTEIGRKFLEACRYADKIKASYSSS